MSEFVKYQHLERFGNSEVQGIELGTISVFPKLDGTNASIWFKDGNVMCGSRNRELSLDNDNAGFCNWVMEQDNINDFFHHNPNLRLYGEWLVPHTLKTYLDTAWRNFYVFDVVNENGEYLHHKEYIELLKQYDIDFIPCIAEITNCSYEKLIELATTNSFLIKDNEGVGEGIVIKKYDFVNRYGRTTFAKIVNSEFKSKHTKGSNPSEFTMSELVEDRIVNTFVTETLVLKEKSKIENEKGFENRDIPRLLNTVFYCLIKEEMTEILKKFKNPTINFKTLQQLTFSKVKELAKL